MERGLEGGRGELEGPKAKVRAWSKGCRMERGLCNQKREDALREEDGEILGRFPPSVAVV